QNPELLAGALHVRAAHGDVVTAGLLPNPTLSAGAGNFPLGRTNPRGIGVGDTVVSQVGLEEEVLLPTKRGARLAAAHRREDAADVGPVGTLALPPAPEDAAHLASEALERRPDLRAAERVEEAAEAALRLARAERWPNPTLGVQYTHSEFQVSGDLANQVGTTISVPLPVFNWNQGEIERAEAEALIARHEVEKLRLAIPQEVRSAVASYTIARERVARFEEAFLRQAGEARHAAEVSFREGA